MYSLSNVYSFSDNQSDQSKQINKLTILRTIYEDNVITNMWTKLNFNVKTILFLRLRWRLSQRIFHDKKIVLLISCLSLRCRLQYSKQSWSYHKVGVTPCPSALVAFPVDNLAEIAYAVPKHVFAANNWKSILSWSKRDFIVGDFGGKWWSPPKCSIFIWALDLWSHSATWFLKFFPVSKQVSKYNIVIYIHYEKIIQEFA